jgi:hypothetical protein
MGKSDAKDYVILGKVVDDKGSRRCIRHKADHQWEAGTVTPVRQGDPIQHALVVNNTSDEQGRFEVTAEIRVDGPPKVVTNEYREGWDRVFGKKGEDIVSLTINPCCQVGIDPKDLN